MAGLLKNNKVPKDDATIKSTLEFLLVHSFFTIRKVNKKSPISALHVAPKPALTEATAANCRAKFYSCLVEVTTASNANKEGKATNQQGCDANGKLWLRRVVDTLNTLEADTAHVELMLDADEEIKKPRQDALATLSALDKAKPKSKDLARGVEILIAFSLLQTYDESEDALELLDEANGAAERMFNLTSAKASSSAEDEHAPIDTLLDVLIALLDKGSAELRNLANLIVGMVASAFTPSSIEHLVAVSTEDVPLARADPQQLEQTAPETIEVDDDEAMDDNDNDEVDEEEDEEVSEEDEEESDDESLEEDEEEDANLEVDPEFRKRVAEALQVSGIDLAEDGSEGSDDESDEEVWDDEKMMKVDEQLAEVFRQRANAGKSKDFKSGSPSLCSAFVV